MRTALNKQLDALTTAIADMCALAGRAMQEATQALLGADAALAERVIGGHDKMVLNAVCVEQDAFSLLALQAPVASDLRIVVASLRNVADADRMGALALHVAKIVRRRRPTNAQVWQLLKDVNRETYCRTMHLPINRDYGQLDAPNTATTG